MAWTTPSSSTDDVLWTQTSTGPLTRDNPLKLNYTTEVAKIDRTIAIDDNYMFTITDVLTNLSTQAITLTQQAQMRQRALHEHTTTPVSEQQAHRGVLGTYGARQTSSSTTTTSTRARPCRARSRAAGNALTTKYWMAATIPEQTEEVTMLGGSTKMNGETTFTAGYQLTPYTVQPGQSVTKTAKIFAGQALQRAGAITRRLAFPTSPTPSTGAGCSSSPSPSSGSCSCSSSWFGLVRPRHPSADRCREDGVLPAPVRHVQIDVEDAAAAARDEIHPGALRRRPAADAPGTGQAVPAREGQPGRRLPADASRRSSCSTPSSTRWPSPSRCATRRSSAGSTTCRRPIRRRSSTCSA